MRVEAIRNHKSELAGNIPMELQYWERLMKVKQIERMSDVSYVDYYSPLPIQIELLRNEIQWGVMCYETAGGHSYKALKCLANAPYIVAVELGDQGVESRIYVAAAVDLRTLELHMSDQMERDNIDYMGSGCTGG